MAASIAGASTRRRSPPGTPLAAYAAQPAADIQQQAAERERRRLAGELHDTVIQQILAAGMTIGWCLGEVPADSPVHKQLEHAKRLTSAAARQLRSSLQDLTASPGTEAAELPELLRRMVQFHANGRLRLSLQITGTPVELPAQIRGSLYRIASECLFNSAVHGCARRAAISLCYAGGLVTLNVADDGLGDPETVRKIMRGEVPGTGSGFHTGLADMTGTATDLGGTLRATASSLGGIAVITMLPVRPHQHESGYTDG